MWHRGGIKTSKGKEVFIRQSGCEVILLSEDSVGLYVPLPLCGICGGQNGTGTALRSQYFTFPLSVSFHQFLILIYNRHYVQGVAKITWRGFSFKHPSLKLTFFAILYINSAGDGVVE
jgi:hypothetical protein